MTMTRSSLPLVIAAVAAAAVAGCNTLDRVGEVGEAPRMTNIQNPTARPGHRPVVMPMPAPTQVSTAPNSLWRTGSRAFFKDQRASNVGDIVTIVVNIDDNARLTNTSTRRRNNNENAAADAFLGYEQSLHQLLPESIDPMNLVELSSEGNSQGSGEISRDEAIEVKVAAVVTQILPNGNLVVQGRQEIRVNYEMRELEVGGVIRPQDITSSNTISSDKIAEARVAYGGRGHISDVQQPRYGQQLYDVVFPF